MCEGDTLSSDRRPHVVRRGICRRRLRSMHGGEKRREYVANILELLFRRDLLEDQVQVEALTSSVPFCEVEYDQGYG